MTLPFYSPAPRSFDVVVLYTILITAILCTITKSDWRNAILDSFVPASSPIDWCEENYIVVNYIAEFWNTLTAPAMCIVPVILRWQHHMPASPRAFNFVGRVSMLSLLCIGIGSAYFHATLAIMGQVLDEITICWALLYGCLGSIGYPALADVIGKRAARILYSPHCAIFVFVMHPLVAILLPLLSHAVVLAMFPIGLYQTYAVTRKVSGMLKDIRIANRLRRAFWLGTMTCLTAVACWIVDKLGCDHIGGGFSRYGLHWCWHLLICLCAYLTTIVHVFCGLHNDDPRGLDIKTHKRLGMLMPVIRGGFLI